MTKIVSRNIWVDYLRSALTVLVVAHHSSLAYTTFASFDKIAYIRSTHAIVDDKRWVGLDIFENFNDVFFMSLMFLIGGLFLSSSIKKKGAWTFVRERFFRLFLPFILGGTFLMLIAYFPSYYVAKGSADIGKYVNDFFNVEMWPVGPPWFIWVLFLFNVLFALLYLIFPKIAGNTSRFFSWFQTRPWLFVGFIFLITWVLYVPMSFAIGTDQWTGFGPFDFQVNRILLYFGYFLLGTWIGSAGFNENLFSLTSEIINKWALWVTLALVTYIVLTLIPPSLTQMVKDDKLSEVVGYTIYFSIYTASCTFSGIAFITAFRKLAQTPMSWWDSLAANAYLIYLVHYVFVTWTQFLLLDYDLPAFLKFLITFIVALVLSWIVSSVLRKVSWINKYL
ncbi:acyltransferase family protein [Dyadobacter arcticus]|uniref:Acyltransferase 3 domain-containing protein n=1 Tax=Dyadobacter arcticus TaxID=1078754 RepID=A0ABX0ULA9_9BACT|nr:acyltransferase [Dyadobacter arcticus]NIJ53783.1 hypothetical protein [Dyadobacter arcticus]